MSSANNWDVSRIMSNIDIICSHLGKNNNVGVGQNGNLQVDDRSYLIKFLASSDLDFSKARIHEICILTLQNFYRAINQEQIKLKDITEVATPQQVILKSFSISNIFQEPLNEQERLTDQKLVNEILKIKELLTSKGMIKDYTCPPEEMQTNVASTIIGHIL
ncbi:MAG: hypothetical protein PVI40_04670 [Chlamydiota bacterium]|jgi:hypothetical protein